MAKFNALKTERVLPLKIDGIDGLFIRDIPAKRYDEIFAKEKELSNEDMITKMFTEVVCGDDGTAFDEFVEGGFEAITEVVPLALLSEIILSIKLTLIPTVEDLGN